MSQLVRNLL